MADLPTTDLETYIMATSPVEQRAPEPEVKALDSYVDLLNFLAETKRMVAFWKGEEEKVRERLAQVMGDAEIGTVDGQEVLTFRKEDRFRGADFKKAYPDTHKLYTREVVEQKFDLASFKLTRPELYEEFRVRSMKSNWEEAP